MLRFAVAAAAMLAAPAAHAGVFGGFSKDGGSYLRGQDQICQPIRGGSEDPSCRSADAREIAEAHFRRGDRQSGRDADFKARARGTLIQVFGSGGKKLASYQAGSAVSQIDQVFARVADRLVAVEYRTRFGRRLVEEVVVFDLGPAGREAAGNVGEGGAGSVSVGGEAGEAAPEPVEELPEEVQKARAKVLAKAKRLLRRKRWRKAKAMLGDLLEVAPGDPEARFHLAGCQAALGARAKAVETLQKIAYSGHPKAPFWLVEARTHRYFRKLRTDKDWRKAVGLLPDPKRRPSAYERVAGLGGHWEQAAIPCEQPRVNLKLDRKNHDFSLRIRARCQGTRDTTRLRGSWRTEGNSRLILEFPNNEGPEEDLTCSIEVCRDGSGEDCVRCQPAQDLEFLLRAVRR